MPKLTTAYKRAAVLFIVHAPTIVEAYTQAFRRPWQKLPVKTTMSPSHCSCTCACVGHFAFLGKAQIFRYDSTSKTPQNWPYIPYDCGLQILTIAPHRKKLWSLSFVLRWTADEQVVAVASTKDAVSTCKCLPKTNSWRFLVHRQCSGRPACQWPPSYDMYLVSGSTEGP